MAAVAKKCCYSNTSKIILFDFNSRIHQKQRRRTANDEPECIALSSDEEDMEEDEDENDGDEDPEGNDGNSEEKSGENDSTQISSMDKNGEKGICIHNTYYTLFRQELFSKFHSISNSFFYLINTMYPKYFLCFGCF